MQDLFSIAVRFRGLCREVLWIGWVSFRVWGKGFAAGSVNHGWTPYWVYHLSLCGGKWCGEQAFLFLHVQTGVDAHLSKGSDAQLPLHKSLSRQHYSRINNSIIFCRTWTAPNRSLILLRKLFSKSLHYTLFQNVLDLLKSLQSLASQLGGAFRIRTPRCCWNLQLRRVKELSKERQGCELPMTCVSISLFLSIISSQNMVIWHFGLKISVPWDRGCSPDG